jgi:hypothetical protein
MEKLFEIYPRRAVFKKISEWLLVVIQAYLAFRKIQEEKFSHPNFHGARDYYSIIKYIFRTMKEENLTNEHEKDLTRKFLNIVHVGIEKNFNGIYWNKKRSADIFRSLFHEKCRKLQNFSQLASSGFDDIFNSVFYLIRENLQDPDSRYLLLFTENPIVDMAIAHKVPELTNKSKDKVIYLHGSPNKADQLALVTKIPIYMSYGYTVIMKDLDH